MHIPRQSGAFVKRTEAVFKMTDLHCLNLNCFRVYHVAYKHVADSIRCTLKHCQGDARQLVLPKLQCTLYRASLSLVRRVTCLEASWKLADHRCCVDEMTAPLLRLQFNSDPLFGIWGDSFQSYLLSGTKVGTQMLRSVCGFGRNYVRVRFCGCQCKIGMLLSSFKSASLVTATVWGFWRWMSFSQNVIFTNYHFRKITFSRNVMRVRIKECLLVK